MTLTDKQRAVYEYIREYMDDHDIAPSYDEIRQHFGFQSFQSVQKHLHHLEQKGFILKSGKNQKRAIQLIEHGGKTIALQMAGFVAAGRPIEAIEQHETVHVPEEMVRAGEYFALKVQGESMIDEGIMDGDTIVVKKQRTASNGQTIVALVEGEATVKKYYRWREGVELRPANPTMHPIVVTEGEMCIEGIVVGLLRQYA